MKQKLTLLFFISMFFMSFLIMAQENDKKAADTVSYKGEKYGLRLGADLSKLARTVFEEGFSGFELNGDLRFSKRFYLAAEIGNETRDFNEENLKVSVKGSFLKIGVDYNAYKNWLGLENAIFTGLRYGFSSFEQELVSFSISTTNPTFPTETVNASIDFDGLTASWVEFIFGVKTEVLNNLYLSINLQLKRTISKSSINNFDHLIIPGFNRTNDFSEFGVGYGYTISYVIPFLRKK